MTTTPTPAASSTPTFADLATDWLLQHAVVRAISTIRHGGSPAEVEAALYVAARSIEIADEVATVGFRADQSRPVPRATTLAMSGRAA